jgi:hypothetical protein
LLWTGARGGGGDGRANGAGAGAAAADSPHQEDPQLRGVQEDVLPPHQVHQAEGGTGRAGGGQHRYQHVFCKHRWIGNCSVVGDS